MDKKGSSIDGLKSTILRKHLHNEVIHRTKTTVGRVLTVVDAISENETRRKAIHDLIEQAIWGDTSRLQDEILRTCNDVAELLGEKKKELLRGEVARASIFNN